MINIKKQNCRRIYTVILFNYEILKIALNTKTHLKYAIAFEEWNII